MLGKRGMMQFNNILSELEDMAQCGYGDGISNIILDLVPQIFFSICGFFLYTGKHLIFIGI